VEHRKDKRFGERDRVIIRDAGRAPAHPTKNAINAYTYDLSLTGARIGCKKEFAVGAIVHIVIDLERSEQFLKVDGRVVWAQTGPGNEPYEIGVQFLHNIPDTILALIRHFYGKNVGIPSLIC
jgi:Tfp pilus assembly protein PilZ